MNKKAIIIQSDDPDSILSYGIQTKLLSQGLKDSYDFHIISNQYNIGIPIKRDGFVKWSVGQNPHNSPNMGYTISKTKPFIVFTLGDIQHFMAIQDKKPINIPWVAWFPWDNHDEAVLPQFANTLRMMDVRITISKFAQEFLTKRGVEVHEQIYNIVDTDHYKPIRDFTKYKDFNKAIIPVNKWIEDGKKILLFVGRPNWRKRVSHLMCIFDKILQKRDDVRLYLHVDFNDKQASETCDLNELLHGLNLYDKVARTTSEMFQMGGAPPQFLNYLYNIADLYVTPHGGEGFGLPIAESMACETPFIATNCTTTPEFVGPNEERGIGVPIATNVIQKNVMRPYVDIKKFVDKTCEILDDDDKRKEMGKAGRKWVLRNCSKEVVLSKFDKLFSELNTPSCTIDFDLIRRLNK